MKKKLLLIVLATILALSLVLCLVACDDPTPDPDPDPDPNPNPNPNPSEETVYLALHYQRTDKAYSEWGFWIWLLGKEGVLYGMNESDDFGGIAKYPLSDFGANATSTIGIIPRRMDGWTKDVDADRMLDLSQCTADSEKVIHIYIYEGDVELYKDLANMKYTVSASFTKLDQIRFIAKSEIKSVKVFEDGELFCEADGESKQIVSCQIPADKTADINKTYTAEVVFADGDKVVTIDISSAQLVQLYYDSENFINTYSYNGELGAIYSQAETVFRVWSPVSSEIVLNIYNNGDGGDAPQKYDMIKGEKGVFEYTLSGDCAGKYYTYTVYNSSYPKGQEIVDPYAKSAGLNGRRGMVVDFAATNPSGWDQVQPVAYDRKELVVWETHVADVTSSVTWTGSEANRKKFLGMAESGTTYTQDGITVKTGFDHIVELGVNAVQIVPIFDQANSETNVQFNWGYNPLNYNVLEGAYSTDATDGYVRIREFKQLVQAFNAKDINIIMDVVYNHVNSSNGSNFDVLMPGYYFRYNNSGALSNGSGCGNETASERVMMRKFIIDSVCFWAKEYKLGGFRFDLMGLHDLETMELLTAALKEINPDIVVYGEPWAGGTAALPSGLLANQMNGNKFVGYGQFNDQMRDAMIKSGMKGFSEVGWVTGTKTNNKSDLASIVAGLQGTTKGSSVTIADPNKTVNYATCHDNFTLYDRIAVGLGLKDETTIKQMAMLANSVVFTSNGTTFMLAGEEFLRTKYVDGATKDQAHNSYQSSYKINELDYSRKITYADMFENYQKLIQLKKTCGGLHLNAEEIEGNYTVTTSEDGAVIQIVIKDGDKTYTVVHANGTAKDVTVNLAGCTLYLDTLNVEGLKLTAETPVAAYQTIIAYK